MEEQKKQTWAQKNPERYKELKQKWQKENKDKIYNSVKQWRNKNKDKFKLQQKEYRKKNKELILKAQKESANKNPLPYKIISVKANHKKQLSNAKNFKSKMKSLFIYEILNNKDVTKGIYWDYDEQNNKLLWLFENGRKNPKK